MKRIEIFLLLLIIFLGVYLRSPEIRAHNYLFGFDQGRDYLAVQKIWLEKKLTLIGSEAGAGMAGLKGIFHGPYYYYSLVPFFWLFNGDPYGGLVMMFLYGVAALILCFFLVKKIFHTPAALLATFLLAVCPSVSDQSRFLWNHHPSTFFILVAFWFISEIKRNPFRYFFLSAFGAGIIYGFQLAIAVPLLISLFFYVWRVLKIKKLQIYLSGFLGGFLAFLPWVLFEIRHGFMAVRGVSEVFVSLIKGENTLVLGNLLVSKLGSFWLNFKISFLSPPWFSFLILAFLIYSIFWFFRKEENEEQKTWVKFLLILLPVTLIIFLFLPSDVWNYYLIHLHLVYIFLLALFLTQKKVFGKKIILFIFLILMIPGIMKEFKEAYQDYFDHGGTAKIRGKLEALDYLYQDSGGEEFNVLVFTPPVYDYAYRYLFDWYGQEKYHYVPGDQKEGLVYLWIEPSGYWHQGWLETVIKTGQVLDEVTLPNGFIIQKRYFDG